MHRVSSHPTMSNSRLLHPDSSLSSGVCGYMGKQLVRIVRNRHNYITIVSYCNSGPSSTNCKNVRFVLFARPVYGDREDIDDLDDTP